MKCWKLFESRGLLLGRNSGLCNVTFSLNEQLKNHGRRVLVCVTMCEITSDMFAFNFNTNKVNIYELWLFYCIFIFRVLVLREYISTRSVNCIRIRNKFKHWNQYQSVYLLIQYACKSTCTFDSPKTYKILHWNVSISMHFNELWATLRTCIQHVPTSLIFAHEKQTHVCVRNFQLFPNINFPKMKNRTRGNGVVNRGPFARNSTVYGIELLCGFHWTRNSIICTQ